MQVGLQNFQKLLISTQSFQNLSIRSLDHETIQFFPNSLLLTTKLKSWVGGSSGGTLQGTIHSGASRQTEADRSLKVSFLFSFSCLIQLLFAASPSSFRHWGVQPKVLWPASMVLDHGGILPFFIL